MIYPLKETHPNLHIFTGIHVKHVIFDEYVWQFFDFQFMQSLNLCTAKTVLQELPSHSTHYSIPVVQQRSVPSVEQGL